MDQNRQVRCMKQTLEAYVAKKYDLSTFLSDMQAHIGFLRRFRKNQVSDRVAGAKCEILFCTDQR